MVKIPDLFEILGARGPGGFDPTELRQFLAGAGPNNRHLTLGQYDAYLRRSVPRGEVARGHTLKRSLDLGSVQRTDLDIEKPGVEDAAMRRQPAKFRNPRGKFRELMALLEEEARKAGYDSVYAEQILNEFLPDVLQSMGYRLDENAARMNPTTPSMWKRLR